MEMWELKLAQKEKKQTHHFFPYLCLCQALLLVHVLFSEMSSVASISVLFDFHEG